MLYNNIAQWLIHLSNLHPKDIDFSLDRITNIAQGAKLLKPAPIVITVAGTNGKGSTCAIMEAILLDAGFKVGVYSSPHLITYAERVRINNSLLSEHDHCEAFSYIEHIRGHASLTVFEFGTLAALYLFKKQKIDILLLEVGLGGRLDATNIVEHDISVITSIDFDHTNYLGNDLNSIGFEKAGIFRASKPAICGQLNAPASIAAHADDINAKLFQVGINFNYQTNYSTDKQHTTWQWQHGAFILNDLPIPHLPLANAATALMALFTAQINISDLNIVNGLTNARLDGRMQVLQQTTCSNPLIILDVAHNPHSAAYLTTQLTQTYIPTNFTGKIHLVIGMLEDKDIHNTLKQLIKLTKLANIHWYLATLSTLRGSSAQNLLEKLSHFEDHINFNNVSSYTDPNYAFKNAMQHSLPNDIIIVTGSFHTVGEVLSYWQQLNDQSNNNVTQGNIND